MEEKIYFVPGDIVTIKHPLQNKPNKMLVSEKVERSIKLQDGKIETSFVGIKCRWFNLNQELQEAIFSTKDLMHVNNE